MSIESPKTRFHVVIIDLFYGHFRAIVVVPYGRYGR
jgi:hypothetical protein